MPPAKAGSASRSAARARDAPRRVECAHRVPPRCSRESLQTATGSRCQVALEQQVQRQHGNAGHDDDPVLHRLRRLDHFRVGALVLRPELHHRARDLAGREKIPEHELDRVEIRLVQVDEGAEEVVPLPDAVEEQHDDQDGRRDGQQDPEEVAEVSVAVQLARRVELRDVRGTEKGARDEQVDHLDPVDHEQGPVCVAQPQGVDHDVLRDETAREEDGDEEKKGEGLPAGEIAA